MVDTASLCLNCMTDKGDAAECIQCGPHPKAVRNSVALPERTELNHRFIVGRVLGEPGGFGVTYLVWDKVLEAAAAIKEFLPLASVSREPGSTAVRPNSVRDGQLFRRGLQIFLKEAKALAQFSHPNIVRIRDCFTANNTAYLVMDYHRGQPLNQLLKNEGGRLSEARALELMLPILDALTAIHQQNFLHRDIKPQNIYVTADNRPILLDFGAAREALTDATKTMTVMLSAGFAPFEQYHRKGGQGPWTDVYACAATLYSMVTGQVPKDAIERSCEDGLVAPDEINPSLRKQFSQAIVSAMAVDAAMRPQTIAAFRATLVDDDEPVTVVNHFGQTIVVEPAISKRRTDTPAVPAGFSSRQRTTQPWPGRVYIIACLLVSGGIVWYSSSRQQPTEVELPQTALLTADRDYAKQTPLSLGHAVSAQPGRQAMLNQVEDSDGVGRQEHSPADSVQLSERIPQFNPPHPGIEIGLHTNTANLPLPPQEALSSCQDKSERSRCSVLTPSGTQAGRCVLFREHVLACVPDSHRAQRFNAGLPAPSIPR